ncbi:MAG: 23S rRNA (guanosine(2251)-2'-O)-methyltransferase RlmB [Candidatus Paceibacterota bacterium]|jgi:23S rRNA (guanosine2251-2'-O)-methyltransferase
MNKNNENDANNSEDIVYGRHPVEELLVHSPERIEKIFLKDSIGRKGIEDILNQASKRKIPVSFVPDRKISDLAGKDSVSQGIVALISPTKYFTLKEWLPSVDMDSNPIVIVLDELEDPHNVGAILRSAAAAGASGVILGKHNQAQVNATVYKTSAGTAGRVPIVRVSNINDALKNLKDAGFWIIGLDGNSKKTLWQEDFNSSTALVVGSEGSGIRTKTLEACDFTVSIPMQNNVESLNASVSTALVLYEWARRKAN